MAGILLPMQVTGCRSTATANYGPAVVFNLPERVALPEGTSYAKKRGFADFDADGLEDMLEIRDEAIFGQNFTVTVFPGERGENGVLRFSNTTIKMPLPIDLKWFSSETKIDTGDVNGDGYADVIFTQYVEKFGNDVMYVAFALNDHEKNFVPYRKRVTWSGGELGAKIWSWAERHRRSSDDSLYDYLKMDWGDMNGDGSDDLVLAWDDWNDLDLAVLYTRVDESGQDVSIQNEGGDRINGFTTSRSIREFDIEDFNGDGKQDLFIHRSHLGGASFTTTLALNQGDTHFQPRQDHQTTDSDMSFVHFEKYDTFDVNLDGCADFVHLGVYQGQNTMSYNTSVCSR